MIEPPAIDRVNPTLRPSDRVSMRHRWAHLLFLHWDVPAETLRPLVPTALEIDTFEGHAYVGLVPFTMTGIRPVWAPAVPGLSSFHEVNVRTYVHREGRDPGVWFFSLDAVNRAAVLLARRFWGLPYHFARMSMDLRGDVTEYRSERLWPGPTPAGCRLSYRAVGEPSPAKVGSLEHFLAERYILYSERGGRLFSGRVHHSPYPLQRAEVLDLEETLVRAAGIERPDAPPLAHHASEVRVRVYPLRSERGSRGETMRG